MKTAVVALTSAAIAVAAFTATAKPEGVNKAAQANTGLTYVGTPAKPVSVTEQEVAALFDRWNAALATGKPEEVAKLYAPNGVLQPTVSNEVRDTPEKIQDYFTKFLAAKPQGTINYRQIRVLDDNTALDSGVYTFALVREGKPTKVQARYSYLYEKTNGEWKIVNHHSSAMPEPVDTQKL
jgi:uncharacterized protein (TIGR02246 family)